MIFGNIFSGFKENYTKSLNELTLAYTNSAIAKDADTAATIANESANASKANIVNLESGAEEVNTVETVKNTVAQGVNNSQKAASIPIIDALKLRVQALSVATGLSTTALGGIAIAAIAITAGVVAYNTFNETLEETREKVNKLNSDIETAKQEANSNAKTIENIKDRYEELSKGVGSLGQNISLTKDEYEEYNDIVNQIADNFPDLIKGYTDEGAAILSVKGNVEELIDKYKEAQREANNLILKPENIKDFVKEYRGTNMPSHFDMHGSNITSRNKQLLLEEIMGTTDSNDITEYIRKMVYKDGVNLNDIIGFLRDEIGFEFSDLDITNKNRSIELTNEELANIKQKAKITVSTYATEVESSLKNVKSIGQAYLENNHELDGFISEDGSNIQESFVSMLVNSLDVDEVNAIMAEDAENGMQNFVQKYIDLINGNPTIQKYVNSLFTTDLSTMSVPEQADFVNRTIESIADLLHMDKFKLRISLGFDTEDLQQQYNVAINNAKEKFGTDETEFFSKHSINTQEEIDKWNSIANACDSAIETEKKYAETTSNFNITDIFELEDADGNATKLGNLSENIDKIQNAYKTLSEAASEYEQNKSFSVDTLQEIISLGDDWLDYLVDEDGNLKIDKQSLEDLTNARINDMKVQAQNNIISQVKDIMSNVQANEYLASTNYDVAESTIAVSKAIATANIQSRIASGEISKRQGDAVLNKMNSDLSKIDTLFSNVTLTPLTEATDTATDDITKDFDNIADAFETMIDTITKNISNIQNVVGLLEEQGQVVGDDFYNSMISQTDKKREIYKNMYNSLNNELNSLVDSGAVIVGSANWQTMYGKLQDINGEIISCDNDIEGFNNSLLQLHWDNVERVANAFSSLKSEIDNVIGMLDVETVLGESGGWTDDAITNIGLLFNQLELGQATTEKYAKEISYLNEQYAGGKYSQTEYVDKLTELTQSQWEGVQMSEDAKKALMDLAKARVDEECEAIDKEVDEHSKLIDKIREEINLKEEQMDYAENLAEAQKEVDRIQRQLNALGNNDTAEGNMKRQQLLSELEDANKDLTDIQHDYYIEQQNDALDKEEEAYQEMADKKKETLNDSLKDAEKVLTSMSEFAKQNASVVVSTLNTISKEHGIVISSTLKSAWQSGSNAISGYGAKLNTSKSVFKENINQISSYFNTLVNKANEVDVAILSAFNLDNGNIMSKVDEIANNFDSIVAAANAASDAINNMSSTLGKVKAELKYRIVYPNGQIAKEGFTDRSQAESYITSSMPKDKIRGVYIETYSTGGMVGGKTDKNIQSMLGEDTMIAAKKGEYVLSKKQTESWMKLVPNLNTFNDMFEKINKVNIPSYLTPIGNSGVNIESPIISINVAGDATSDTIKKFEQVAKTTVSNEFNKLAQKIYMKGVR